MKINCKILIIGFGSIGQRHYKNLKELGFEKLFVYDPGVNKQITQGVNVVKDLTHEALKRFDVAIICSPNNLHIEQAIMCAEAGCHLFIEKPLSHNLGDIERLEEICKKNNLVSMIGCNMRFHPCLAFIKDCIKSNKLGKVYSIDHECGYYLPYWRPGTDYRHNYAVKKDAGGGIILDDIHEFDLLFWLNDFAEVERSNFLYDRVSDLELETEDSCRAIFKFKNKALGSVRCDYLQKSYSRNCKIVAEKGNLEWDFKENIVWLKEKDKKEKLFHVKDFDFNQVYIEEIKYYFDCLEGKKQTFNDVATAGRILKYCVEKK